MIPLYFLLLFVLVTDIKGLKCWDEEKVYNFHFHTQFFQNNNESVNEARKIREKVNRLISKGILSHCTVECKICDFNMGPFAEFTVGNFLTCCNKSSVTNAIEFFSKNRGSLSVLVHPVTLHPIVDHTQRTLWMGQTIPLELSNLPAVRNPPILCV